MDLRPIFPDVIDVLPKITNFFLIFWHFGPVLMSSKP